MLDLEEGKKSLKFCSVVVLVFILIDQLTKFLLRIFLAEKVFINQNFFFGFNFNISLYYLVIFLLLVLIWLYYSKNKFGQSFILAGGVSNLIDRLFLGGVVDYNIEKIVAFNLADLLIVFGVLYILYLNFFKG